MTLPLAGAATSILAKSSPTLAPILESDPGGGAAHGSNFAEAEPLPASLSPGFSVFSTAGSLSGAGFLSHAAHTRSSAPIIEVVQGPTHHVIRFVIPPH